MTINPTTKAIKYEAMKGKGMHDDAVCSLAIGYKHLELGRTATPQEFFNRFAW